MKRTAWITTLLLLTALPQTKVSASPIDEARPETFVCNTGYTLQKCAEDMSVLRKALAKYPVTQLGQWTWILVLSKDWKAIVTARGLDPDSPAFTYYAKRETFIEEVLVTSVPGRDGELVARWHMRAKDLLDLALAHELGHCFCNDKSEAVANAAAEKLINGKTPSCEKLRKRFGSGEIRKSRQ